MSGPKLASKKVASFPAMVLFRGSDYLSAHTLPPEELIFGRSPLMAAVREKLDRAASTTIPVLLQGESGTGKDVLAKRLHLCSTRSTQPWVKVTCPAIPGTLIESELFGYEKGAFTGAYTTKRGRVELSHRGTLFLDEVGSLDLISQAKLLQVLQDGTFMRVGAQESRRVDMRLICAANGDLRQQAENGSFRPDLFFRINAVTVGLPPLRKRTADLPMLIDHFMDLYARMFRVSPKPISRGLLEMMQCFPWPGNIRQLENMIRTYVLMGNEESVVEDLLPIPHTDYLPEIDLDHPISLKDITRAATEELERRIILKVLHAHKGSRSKTAKWLNISYRSLLYKLGAAQSAGLDALSPRTRAPKMESFEPLLAAPPESIAAD